MLNRITERTANKVGVLQEDLRKLNRHYAAQDCDATADEQNYPASGGTGSKIRLSPLITTPVPTGKADFKLYRIAELVGRRTNDIHTQLEFIKRIERDLKNFFNTGK